MLGNIGMAIRHDALYVNREKEEFNLIFEHVNISPEKNLKRDVWLIYKYSFFQPINS